MRQTPTGMYYDAVDAEAGVAKLRASSPMMRRAWDYRVERRDVDGRFFFTIAGDKPADDVDELYLDVGEAGA